MNAERAPTSGVRRRPGSPLDVAVATDTGRRTTNADAHVIDQTAGFFAVADGKGDTLSSACAARMALDAVGALFFAPWAAWPAAERSTDKAIDRLRRGLEYAHRRLYAPGRSEEQQMGTTFAGVVACGEWICATHFGDSRVYLLHRREARLERLTDDHTVLGEAVRRGTPYASAAALPNGHALTRMLGLSSRVEVEPIRRRWEPGDIILLCTDGVSDCVATEELTAVLLDVDDLADAAHRIVARASDHGGGDNATALVVRAGLTTSSSGGLGMNPRGRVLVIDDEPLHGSLVRRVLRDHDVTATTSGAEALARIGAGETFDLILCDVMMPDLSGVDFHERLALMAPTLLDRIVFMTGGAFTPRTVAFLEGASIRVLKKPFDLDELRTLAREHLPREGTGSSG